MTDLIESGADLLAAFLFYETEGDKIVTRLSMTFPQNCAITFDVTTTLGREYVDLIPGAT